MSARWVWAGLAVALLAGCAGGGGGHKDADSQASASKSGNGRYAMDSDAYPELPPDVSDVPDAVPRVEPLARSGNRPTYEVWGKTYHVLPNADGYAERGVASWYGKKFHGYATDRGEIYDMYKMSAAHRSLPLPTYARITNLDNDRSVIVKVNDRGPFHGDRLIDLSYAAAARLDILRNGTGRVRVEAIDPVAWQANQRKAGQSQQPGEPATALAAQTPSQPVSRASAGGASDEVYLQVAALGSAVNAQALRDRLQSKLDSPVRIDSDERLHSVQVGPIRDPLTLEALRSELSRVGYAQSFTITPSD